MNTPETPWTRLSRLIHARLEHLGITQAEVERRGGPSTVWIRKLKGQSGKPSGRQGKTLRVLSTHLGWSEDTAWSIVADDRSAWSQDVLAAEEHDLVYGSAPKVDPAPVSPMRRLLDQLRADDMAGVTEAEWSELLDAIESKMPEGSKRVTRSHRGTGT